jgi:hypothetical protein
VNGAELNGYANSEALIKIIKVGTVRNFNVSRLFRTGTASGQGNSLGGVVIATDSEGSALVEEGIVQDSGGFFGTAFYASDGAAMISKRITAKNIDDNGQVGVSGDPIYGLAFYGGGEGNQEWHSCIADNCTGTTTSGIAAYAHNPERVANAAKTMKVYNCTFTNTPSTATQPAVAFLNIDPDGSLAVDIKNTVFDNGVYDLKLQESEGTLNVTMTTCHVTGGASAISTDVTNGTVDTGTYTTGDPELSSSYAPGNSALKGVGTWIAGIRAYDDLPLPLHPDIGAVQDRDYPGRKVSVGGGQL